VQKEFSTGESPITCIILSEIYKILRYFSMQLP
jgi:hypothetical protein